MTELVLAEQKGALLRLTLNRPEKANALNRAMRQALIDHLQAAAKDEALRALVITGTGIRAFCAGADLKEPGGLGDETWETLAAALAGVPVLTVAAINGHCIGGGLTLALGCDLRLAVPQASFGYPVLRNKVLPGQIDAARLRALPRPRADIGFALVRHQGDGRGSAALGPRRSPDSAGVPGRGACRDL